MKDVVGNEIKIGDKVVFIPQNGYSDRFVWYHETKKIKTTKPHDSTLDATQEWVAQKDK